MAVDNRPFKSKEQDGQGNEVIIRDQQLVEQDTATTMPAGTCFQTLDVDGRPVKISKDNMLNLIVEGLGIIFNGQSDQQTVTKVPTLNGNNFGASTVATLASVLGADKIKFVGDHANSYWDALTVGSGEIYIGFNSDLYADTIAVDNGNRSFQLGLYHVGNDFYFRSYKPNVGWNSWEEAAKKANT